MSEYTLHWKNRFTRGQSPINGDADCSIPFPFLAQDTENKIVQYWTGEQVTKMFSALKTGADLMFPEAANDILWWFLKGIHCAPTVDPDGEGCIEYLPSASFIKFFPDNPYISGDTSAGWNKEAWFLWPQFDTLFPDWFDNWLNGAISSLTNYQATDVLFNLESIPINPIDAFLNGGGTLPKIEINFSGSGELNITLLSFPLGGKAVIELDQEPNILDILTGGLLDPAAFMVELNRDILNFPPDEYPIVQVPLSVPTTGNHTLYICYIPTLDDSLIPVAFGGGFRSVEFCGFPEQGNMGIEQIVWDGCQLKSITAGIETVIVTAAQIEACLDIPEGGGGGSNLIVTALNNTTLTTVQASNTAYDGTARRATAHNFTRSKAWIRASLAVNNSTAGEDTLARISLPISGSMVVASRNEGGMRGTTSREIVIDAVYENIPSGNREVAVELMTSAGGDWIIPQNTIVTYTIVEFEDSSDLFVEDVRIFEGELQKKIGGIWIAVTDSFEAIIQSLQSQVSAAAANAAAAVSTANNALTIAQGAVNVNNTQNTRLTELENFQEDAELSLSQLSLTVNDHESRIDALEAASGVSSPYLNFGVWSQEFSWSDAQISGIAPFTLGLGSLTSLGIAATIESFPQVVVNFSPIINNQITHVAAKIIRLGHTNPIEVQIEVNGLDESRGRLRQVTGSAGVHDVWCRFPNVGASSGMTIQLQSANGDRFYLNGFKFIGRGSNPFI